jgi:DnaJ-class molecular chaperone
VPKFKDYYEVLGISPRSHAKVIEEKYWEQAHELHREPTKRAARRLLLINEAYETLGSPHKRAAYDRKRIERVEAVEQNGRGNGFLQTFVNLLGKPFRPD